MAETSKQSVTDRVRDNPIKSALGVLAALGGLMTTAWAFDGHYNNLPEIGKINYDLSTKIARNESTIQQMRLDNLEDKIFDIELKRDEMGRLSNADNARLNRYKSRLDGIRRYSDGRPNNNRIRVRR